jgi:hypothetical protein
MKQNKIFMNKESDDSNKDDINNIDNEIKILSVFMLQIELWTKHYNISSSSNTSNNNNVNENENNPGMEDNDKNKIILNFFESKIKIISKEIKNEKYKDIFYKYLFDNYIYDYINYIYSTEQYNKAYIKINNFIKNSKINEISNSISYNIYKISKNYFFNNMQSLLNTHKRIIINYISSFTNLRKFFEYNIPMNSKTSSNKDLLDLKYEIFFIFENNFNYIYKNIIDEVLFKFADKIKTVKIFLGHIDEIIEILNEFLVKHGFMLLSEQNLISQFNEFKDILNKIVMKYSMNIIGFFGIEKNFDYKFMLPKLNEFNNLLKEIKELI